MGSVSDQSQQSQLFPDAAAVARLVSDFYKVALNRNPDPDGFEHYCQYLLCGGTVGDILEKFLASDEFKGKFWRDVVGKPAKFDITVSALFPEDYDPPGESGRSYIQRVRSGFFQRYCSGSVVLDVGYSGYDNPEGKAALPHAIGVDLDYPGYDGLHLPFEDASVDTVFSSHCLEHIIFDLAAIRDWYRVLKIGGFLVCMVPSQALYEKKRFPPSRFNADHKRMYTPANFLASIESALEVNSYRVRHLAENDCGFDYSIGPGSHSDGAYEIELVIEKISPPTWNLE